MYKKEDITIRSSSSSSGDDEEGKIVFYVRNDADEELPEKSFLPAFLYPILNFLPKYVTKKLSEKGRRCLIGFAAASAVAIILIVSLSVTLAGGVRGNKSAPASSFGLNSTVTLAPTVQHHDEPDPQIGFGGPQIQDKGDTHTGFLDSQIINTSVPVSVSMQPSAKPSLETTVPLAPSVDPPSLKPTTQQNTFPKTDYPTSAPASQPTESPTIKLSIDPQEIPFSPETQHLTIIPATYVPGNLTHMEHGLLLSQGLKARLLAQSGQTVDLANGNQSEIFFHFRPDAAATFPDDRAENRGGWVYVSNSEVRTQDRNMGKGGVGAITFNKEGNIIKYERVLDDTRWNCGGGRTPWNTFVSCEEAPEGHIYQVDPFGKRTGEKMTLGSDGGHFESFAYDVRDKLAPRFFVTEDHRRGAIRRFTPSIPDWTHPWQLLHGEGTTDYLELEPNENMTGGTFRWTSDRNNGRDNAELFFPNCEGIDAHNGTLFFVSKIFKQLYELDLDTHTYSNTSTILGLFDGGPDQLQRIMEDGGKSDTRGDILYFTEEGGKDAGVHGRNEEGDYFTVLESPVYHDEVTGLAFSPDGLHMYLSYQENGLLFDVYREDGLPFQAKYLNIQYHRNPEEH